MLVAEVLQRELFGVDLVHGGAGVGDRTNLIGVELLPPINNALYHIPAGYCVQVDYNKLATAIHEAGYRKEKNT